MASFGKSPRRFSPPLSCAPSPGSYDPKESQTKIPQSFPQADREIHDRLDTNAPLYNPTLLESNTALKYVQPTVHNQGHNFRPQNPRKLKYFHGNNSDQSPFDSGDFNEITLQELENFPEKFHRNGLSNNSSPSSQTRRQNPFDSDQFTDIPLEDLQQFAELRIHRPLQEINSGGSNSSRNSTSSSTRRNPFGGFNSKKSKTNKNETANKLDWIEPPADPFDEFADIPLEEIQSKPKSPNIFVISGSEQRSHRSDKEFYQNNTSNSSQWSQPNEQRPRDNNNHTGLEISGDYVTPVPPLPSSGIEAIGTRILNSRSERDVNYTPRISEASTGSLRSNDNPITTDAPKFDSHVMQAPLKPWLSNEDVAYWGVICGTACFLFGILQISFFSKKGQCVFAGIWEIILGIVILIIEAALIPSLRLPALIFMDQGTDLINNRPYWLKALGYFILSIISITVCTSWATGVGVGFVISLAVLYAIKQIDQIRKMRHVNQVNSFRQNPNNP